MYCCDTGSFEAIDLSKMVRIPLTVDEAKDIGEAVNAVRSYGHGTGQVCLDVVQGFIEAIIPALKKYRKKPQHKKTN